MNAAAAGVSLDGPGVFHADGKRLLHHHVDLALSACLHYRRVVERTRECGHCFGFGAVQHDHKFRKERGAGEGVALSIFVTERWIRIKDADNINVVAILQRPEESIHMAVNEPRDREPKWFPLSAVG